MKQTLHLKFHGFLAGRSGQCQAGGDLCAARK